MSGSFLHLPGLQGWLQAARHRTVIRLRGTLDYGTASECEVWLAGILPRSAPICVLDLWEVEFLDSEGVRVLLAARQQMARHGGELRLLIRPGGTVERVLNLLRLHRVIAIERGPALPAAVPDGEAPPDAGHYQCQQRHAA